MNRAFNADHEERLSRRERVYGSESPAESDDDDNEEIVDLSTEEMELVVDISW